MLSRYLPIATAGALVCVTTLFLWLLQNPFYLGDGLRHLTMASLLKEQGIFNVSGWDEFFYESYFSIISVDPWWLFHVLLMPIADLPAKTGLAIITLVSIAALLGSFLYTIRPLKLAPTIASTLTLFLFLGEYSFAFRLFLGRPWVLITALTLLVLAAVIQRQPLLLAGSLFVAPLLSQLFVFPVFFAGCGCLWLLTLERQRGLRYGAITTGATILGLALHPNPIVHLDYIINGFLRIPFLANLGLATEMYTGVARTLPILESLLISFLSMIGWAIYKRRITWSTLHRHGVTLTAALAIFFLALSVEWQRAIDVLWPVTVLLCAQILSLQPTIITDTLQSVSRRQSAAVIITLIMLMIFWPRLLDFGWPILMVTIAHLVLTALPRNNPLTAAQKQSVIGVSVTALITVLTTALLVMPTYATDGERDLAAYDALKQIPSKARVLNADWDKFPHYVHVRPDLRFATGVENSFLYFTNPQAHRSLQLLYSTLFYDIQPGYRIDGEAWLRDLITALPADYIVFMTARHEKVIETLHASTRLQQISDEGKLTVFQIVVD